MKISSITNNYVPIAYTNQKTKAFAQSTETNLLGEERPKNAQLKALKKSLLDTLVVFGLLSLCKMGTVPETLSFAAVASTGSELIDYSLDVNKKYKLDADEKFANMSILTLLGLATLGVIKKFVSPEQLKNLNNSSLTPVKLLAYFALSQMMLLGFIESKKQNNNRKQINENNQ